MGSWLSPDFYVWLTNHSELVPFIQVESFPSTLKEHEKNKMISKYKKNKEAYVEQLMQFSTEQLVLSEPDLSDTQRPDFDSAKRAVWLYHFICYIRWEIYTNQLNAFNKSLAACSSIISLLTSNDIPETFNVIIDLSGLYKYMLKEDPFVTALRWKFQFTANEYSRFISVPASLAKLKQILYNTLDFCKNQMDKTSSYFYPNNADQRFQQILLTKNSPIYQDFVDFIETFPEMPKNQYTHNLLLFFQKFAKVYELNTVENISVAMTLLMRSAFSYSYEQKPDYFYPKTENLLEPSKFLCSDACTEGLFLSAEELQRPLGEIFDTPEFSAASMRLDFATLYVNPIDALFEIHESIRITQRIVNTKLNRENRVLAFEELFGPLVGVALCSADFLRLGHFVIDFAPASELNPDLDYTLATVKALIKYMESVLLKKVMK